MPQIGDALLRDLVAQVLADSSLALHGPIRIHNH